MIDWPSWLSEARVAIIISLLSAAFTGGTLWYTRRLAKNDTERMRRKPLVVELLPSRQADPTRHGWGDHLLIVRNLEPVGAVIRSIRSRPRKSCVIYVDRHLVMPTTPSLDWVLPEELPETRSEKVDLTIRPVGAVQSASGTPGDTLHLRLMAKGVSRPSDVFLDWEWADGKKA